MPTTIQQKLPNFFRAVDAAHASVHDPITYEDRFLAHNAPVGPGEAKWMSGGFEYSLNRATEHHLAGNPQGASAWNFAAALEILALGNSLGLVSIVGAIAQAIHRAVHHATGPYTRRSADGLREEKIARQFSIFNSEVALLASSCTCMRVCGSAARQFCMRVSIACTKHSRICGAISISTVAAPQLVQAYCELRGMERAEGGEPTEGNMSTTGITLLEPIAHGFREVLR